MDRPDISNLRKNRSVFMNLGFVISLSMVILAFNWTTDVPVNSDFDIKEVIFEEDIPITRTPSKKPKVVPPPSIELSKKIEAQIEDFITELEPIPEKVETKVEVTKVEVKDLPVVKPIVVESLPPAAEPEEIEPKVETIFEVVEEMPRFPGCEEVGLKKADKYKCSTNKLLRYLVNQLKYPRLALENGIKGTAVISFVVGKDGQISDLQIRKDPGAGLGNEALKVAKTMPPWIPGKQRGKEVAVRYNLPVVFRLK